jgi:copper chaperone
MTVQLKVLNMSCGGCVNTITQAVKTVDANAIVKGDPQTKSVSVETKASETAIKEAIAKVGYPAAS